MFDSKKDIVQVTAYQKKPIVKHDLKHAQPKRLKSSLKNLPITLLENNGPSLRLNLSELCVSLQFQTILASHVINLSRREGLRSSIPFTVIQKHSSFFSFPRTVASS